MITLTLILALFAAAFIVLGLRETIRRRHASKLFAFAVAAALCSYVAHDATVEVGLRVAVVLTEPCEPALIVDRLEAAGARDITYIRVDSEEPESTPVTWHDPDAARSVAYRQARAVRTLDQAVEKALASLDQASDDLLDRFRLRRRRLAIVVGDRDRWRAWAPLDVQLRLDQARAAGVTIDLLELNHQPETATIEIAVELDLPAHVPLNTTGRMLQVRVRGTALKNMHGNSVQGRLTMCVGGDAVAAIDRDLTGTVVGADDVLESRVPTSAFGSGVQLAPHFAMFEAEARFEVAGRTIHAKGSAQLPVRTTSVLVGCGSGHPESPLRGGRWTNPAAVPRTAAALELRSLPTLSSPRANTARYEFVDFIEAARRVIDGDKLPDLLVLNEPAPNDWAISKLLPSLFERVHGGMNLAVVDPPQLPQADPMSAALLTRLLPETAAAGPPGAADGPATIDHSPLLLFSFDTNATWATPNSPLPEGFSRQLTLAEGILKRYRDAGLIAGRLTIVEAVPGQAETRRIVYETPDAGKEKVVVAVAPKIAAARTNPPCDPTLANHLLPSQIDLRLATLVPSLLGPTEIAACGLKSTDAPTALASILAAQPSHLPNAAVVIFTTRAVPQALPGKLNPAGPQIVYTLNHAESDPRTLKEVPAGMAARLLSRGVHILPVLLSIEEPPAPMTRETGLNQLAAFWPKQETNLFTNFRTKPSDIWNRATLDSLMDSGIVGVERTRLLDGLAPVHTSNILVTSANPLDVSRWDVIHGSPQLRAAVGFPVLGRVVDERFTLPGPTWAAPRRVRRTVPSPAFAGHRGAFHAVATFPPNAYPLQSAPLPLVVGGRVGSGQVVVLNYSPWEGAPNEAAWPAEAVVDSGNPAVADRLGLSRLIDLATFTGRTRTVPSDQPLVRGIETVDARGGLRIQADFLQKHLSMSSIFEPTLRTNSSSARLSLVGVDAARGMLTYTVGPNELGKLFVVGGADVVSVKLEFAQGAIPTAFAVRRPLAAEWSELSSLESAAALSSLSGGSWYDETESPAASRYGVRLWLILMAAAATLGLAVVRILRDRRRDAIVRLEEARLKQHDVRSLADDLGAHVHERTLARINARIPTRQGPFPGGGDLEVIRRNDLILYGFRKPSALIASFRPMERADATVVVLNLGRSLRQRLGTTEPKLVLAGVAAALVGTTTTRAGSRLRVVFGGTHGETWRDEETFNGPPGDGEIETATATAAKRSAAPLGDLEEIDLQAGSNVFWISDFREELSDAMREKWLLWATGVSGDGGRLTAVVLSSASEASITGWTADAFGSGSLDRTSWTESDGADGLATQAEVVARCCESVGAALVVLNTSMTGEEIVEAFRDADQAY